MTLSMSALVFLLMAINGLIFTGLAFYFKEKLSNNWFVAICLLCFSMMFLDMFIRRTPEVYTLYPNSYFLFTFSHYLIMPSFFLLVRKLTQGYGFKKFDFLHLIPAIVVYYYTGIFNFLKYNSEIKLTAYAGKIEAPSPIAATLIFDLQILVCSILIIETIRRQYDLSYKKIYSKLADWLKWFLALNSLYLVLSITFMIILITSNQYFYIADTAKNYLFFLFIYGWLILIISNPNALKYPIKDVRIWDDKLVNLDGSIKEIVDWIIESELHLDPNTQPYNIAKSLKLSTRNLSEQVNSKLGYSIPMMLNLLRIKEMEARLSNPKFNHYTLIGVAKSVGFKSKTSFYRAFKEFSDEKPSEYFKRIKNMV
ncbi:MAG: helix-turn-helix domain-containing protein [Fulvivirga sp.]|uniref:helix-turn-helix domain-containing protein n=1 Tax=Fulvivirga sp. TaxID=1931237 RepID=UPI0032ED7A12